MWRHRRRPTLEQGRSVGAVAAATSTASGGASSVAATAAPESPRSRRLRRRWKREQYHLVADEIERVLYNDDDEEEENGTTTLPEVPSTATPRAPRLRIPRRLSFPVRQRRSSLSSTFTTTSLPEETPSALPPTTNQLPRRSGRRLRRRRATTTERDINSYSLFDTAGDSNPTGDTGVGTGVGGVGSLLLDPLSAVCAPSTPSSTHRNQPSAVIYTKTYSPSAFFTPILAFLSVTFVLLVIIQIVVSFLTMAVGMSVVALMVLKLLQEFVSHPLRLLQRVHAAPIRAFAALGCLYGLSSAFSRHWLSTNITHMPGVVHALWSGPSMDESNGVLTAQGDFWMMWGCLEGMAYGLKVGTIWLFVLGDAAGPSTISKWLYRLWRRVQVYYRRAARERVRAHLLKSMRRHSNNSVHPDYDNASSLSLISAPDDRRVCMICLEGFQDDASSILSRQHLPCLHGFHAHCLNEWLAIKPTCPICRIPFTRDSQGNFEQDDQGHPLLASHQESLER